MKNFTLVLFIVLLISCDKETDSAKSYEISGFVTTKIGDTLLVDATLRTEPPTKEVLTGSNGEYIISDLESGTYTIIASKDGFLNDTAISVIENTNLDGINLALSRVPGLPHVTTYNASTITSISAISGGNVISSGGLTVTARGICWSTNPMPTTNDSFTVDGEGSGPFISALNNLIPNTSYYIRAYATNSLGTTYGNEVNFSSAPKQYRLVFSQIVINMGAEVFTMNPDGSNKINISKRTNHDDDAVWSPSGRVAYISFNNPQKIVTSNNYGTDELILNIGDFCNDLYGYSPDGSKILFNVSQGLATCDTLGSNFNIIVSGDVRSAAWSPDGSRIAAIVIQNEIPILMKIELPSGLIDTIRIDTNAWLEHPIWVNNNSLAYIKYDYLTANDSIFISNINNKTTIGRLSHHGQMAFLCFDPNLNGFYYNNYSDNTIRSISIDLLIEQDVISLGGLCGGLSVSSDGSKIALIANKFGTFDLFVLNLSTSSLARLTFGSGSVGHPSWSNIKF